MTSYTHHQGKVFVVKPDGKEEEISFTRATAELIAHRKGAADVSLREWTRRASANSAADLEQALGAAEIYARISKPSPDQERLRLASVNRTRKAARQAKGMVG